MTDSTTVAVWQTSQPVWTNALDAIFHCGGARLSWRLVAIRFLGAVLAAGGALSVLLLREGGSPASHNNTSALNWNTSSSPSSASGSLHALTPVEDSVEAASTNLGCKRMQVCSPSPSPMSRIICDCCSCTRQYIPSVATPSLLRMCNSALDIPRWIVIPAQMEVDALVIGHLCMASARTFPLCTCSGG